MDSFFTGRNRFWVVDGSADVRMVRAGERAQFPRLTHSHSPALHRHMRCALAKARVFCLYASLMARKRIKANLSKQAPNNSYSPPLYYEDMEFTCRDCGVACVWTAEQQRLWYEEWGGPVQSTAVRCRACRQKVARAKIEQKRHMAEMAKRKKKRGA